MKKENPETTSSRMFIFLIPVLLIIAILLSAYNFFSLRSKMKMSEERFARVEQATVINTENLRKLVDYINAANQRAQAIQQGQNPDALQEKTPMEEATTTPDLDTDLESDTPTNEDEGNE